MRPIPAAGTLVLGLALLAACADRTNPTAVSTLPRPSFDQSNAPRFSGPIIVRTELGLNFFAFDPERQLFARHARFNGIPACGVPFTVLLRGDLQQVLNPSDAILVMELFRANEIFVTVYDWTGLPEITCDFLVNAPRIAEGRGQLTNTDNDFFAFLRSEPIRANAFGITAQGTVGLTAGGLAHYNAVQRFVFFPPEDGRAPALSINLKPIP